MRPATQKFVVVSFLGLIASETANRWTLSQPDVTTVAWPVHAHRYCSKRNETVPLLQDPTDIHGFDISSKQCRTKCEESVDCNFFSHGKWNKGAWPSLGGFRGKLRCQTYSLCKIAELEGAEPVEMHVFEKPSAPTRDDDALVIAAVVVMAIVNALQLQSQGGIPFFIVGWAVSGSRLAGSKASWDFQNYMFVALVFVHALNCLALMGVVIEHQMSKTPDEQDEQRHEAEDLGAQSQTGAPPSRAELRKRNSKKLLSWSSRKASEDSMGGSATERPMNATSSNGASSSSQGAGYSAHVLGKGARTSARRLSAGKGRGKGPVVTGKATGMDDTQLGGLPPGVVAPEPEASPSAAEDDVDDAACDSGSEDQHEPPIGSQSSAGSHQQAEKVTRKASIVIDLVPDRTVAEDIPSSKLDASPPSQEQDDVEAWMYEDTDLRQVDEAECNAEAGSDAVAQPGAEALVRDQAPAPPATPPAAEADSTRAPEAEATTPTKTATSVAAAAEVVTPTKTAAPAAIPVAAEALTTKPEVADAPESDCYTLEQLRDKCIWEQLDVVATEREKHLSATAFTALFGMSKEDFDKQPKWKKDAEKKKHGLF